MKIIPAIAAAAVLGFAMPVFTGCSEPEDDPPAQPQAAAGDLCVSFIDVGKGDCILIQAGDSASLIDTGYSSTSRDVLAYLRGRNVNHLKSLIITHYDKDHIGGIRSIGKEIPIDTVYLPGYVGADKNYRDLMKAIDELGVSTRTVADGLPLEFGDAHLTIIPSAVAFDPNANGDEGNDNDLSLAVVMTYGKDSYLFTGDLEEEGIASFLEGHHGRFDVLKVPHHGEKSPMSDELLDDTRPQIAVITDSADEPANKKVLKQLSEIGADVYRTSIDGTIAITSDGSGTYTVFSRQM